MIGGRGMFKKLALKIFIIVNCFIMATIPLTISAHGSIKEVENTLNGVVRVLTLYNGTGGATGTGFCVGEEGQPVRYIVTNNHVIAPDANGNEPKGVYILLDSQLSNASVVSVNVIYHSEKPDIAILEIPRPITTRIPLKLMQSRYVKRMDQVYAIGFPGISDELAGNQSKLPSGINDMTITKGIISKTDYFNELLGGGDCYQIDVNINHGNSGGPLVASNGAVIGINTFGEEGINGAIQVDDLIPILTRNGISYIEEKPGAFSQITDFITDNSLLSVVIAVALVLVLAIVIFIVIRKPGRKAAQVSLLAGVNGGSNASPQFQNNFQQRNDTRNIRLHGISGVYSGKDFVIRDGRLTFGRDSKACNIMYDRDTPGISGIHCELAQSNGELVLRDNGSSYGTFLNNIKLEVGRDYKMQRGDKFYLASKANEFQIL